MPDRIFRTDFRTVLAQVAERHLQLGDRQLERVFPGMPRRSAGFQLIRS
jgi:hypothetical protein